jgi:hypothetical protein
VICTARTGSQECGLPVIATGTSTCSRFQARHVKKSAWCESHVSMMYSFSMWCRVCKDLEGLQGADRGKRQLVTLTYTPAWVDARDDDLEREVAEATALLLSAQKTLEAWRVKHGLMA